ncbi:MAG: ABC transporter substrate-binding protein [Nocardiopsaceae bacterium]|nr:ABC transporter substrate-binding protein [Nocardiopsaceae bacterium]
MSVRTACLAGAVALAASTAACGGSSSGASPGAQPSMGNIKNTPPPKAGGSITVLEGKGFSGDWPYGFDPPTDVTGSANQDFYTAVYGQLFDLGPNGKILPDLATGYSFSDGNKTVTITLRKGVTFSDGTPFNAQAVYYNWQRDFGPLAKKAGLVPPWEVARTASGPAAISAPFAKSAVQVTGPDTITVHLTTPDGAFINQLFDTTPMWIGSPAAIKKEGEKKFAQDPVGAGPFTVVSDTYNNQLVVKKNPRYWDKPKPYLNQITFKSASGDEAAYESMLAGQGQVYQDLSTTQILNEAGQHFQELNQPGTSPYDLQLNTASAPFSNVKARQAIYAATDFAPILKAVFGDRYPVTESFTGPGGICYEPKVPGYQGYDPALAKKLIKESGLDKTTITLGTINSSPVAIDTTEALRTEWDKLGMHVNIANYPLDGLIQAFRANGGKNWQAMIQTAGSWDPSAGVGVGFRFLSNAPYSGVHDPHLDQLLFKAQEPTKVSQRCPYYDQAAEYIAKHYYGPFYFTFAPANISVKGIVGPGLTSALPAVAVVPAIPWQDVYYNPSGK